MAKKILIVEDDEASRTGLREILSRQGFDVLAASTFEEGRRLLRTENPDMLVTDLRLGAFNGLQLVAASSQKIPTIIFTAFSDPVLEVEAHKYGAKYLVKPVSPTVLIDMIIEELGPPMPIVASPHPTRRWTRKAVPGGGLPAHADSLPAVIVDVSYGGLRLEVKTPRTDDMPRSFDVKLPADVAVHVDLVWQSRTESGAWLCGASVSQRDYASTRAWYGLVDAIA